MTVAADPTTLEYTSDDPKPTEVSVNVALSMISVPLAAPLVVGVNTRVKIKLPPGVSVAGNGGTFVRRKPLPTTLMPAILAFASPLFVTLISACAEAPNAVDGNVSVPPGFRPAGPPFSVAVYASDAPTAWPARLMLPLEPPISSVSTPVDAPRVVGVNVIVNRTSDPADT